MSIRNAAMPVALIRLLAGWVFLVEGILKFVWPEELGVGRFTAIGIPAPHLMAPFVGVVEVVGGALLLVGLFTRLAALFLLADTSVAIVTTKLPILIGHGFWGFALPKLKHYGALSMLHEARTDFSMLLALIFLLITGAGSASLDSWLDAKKYTHAPVPRDGPTVLEKRP